MSGLPGISSSTAPLPDVPGRPQTYTRPDLDPVTQARLWENPCWFAFRFNYLALRYNIPLYGWIERTHGLARPEFVVIYSLGLKEGVSARDIGISYGFPKTSLSRAIGRLRKRGLVRRAENPADKRSYLLYLSPEGRALYEKTLPAFVGRQEEMLRSLTFQEREFLSVILAKIVLDSFSWPSAEELSLPEEAIPALEAERRKAS